VCDTLVTVRDGLVLFAKNSDRDPNEAQVIEWHPAREGVAPGSKLRCTWITIDEAERTYATILSRPFWTWGAEIAANERGVVAGNEAVFTREPYTAAGLTGMDLVRLAVERGRDADAAADVIVSLLERHGQGGGCGHEDRAFTYHNSFLVADPRRAYVVETAGRRWAIERVHGARSISNGLTIPSFARAHADALRGRVAACAARRARTEAGASGARCVADLFRVLRDHGGGAAGPRSGWPRYAWHNGAMRAPCMHAGGFIASAQTTSSWAAALTQEGVAHWVTAQAAPCVSLFKPVHVDEPVDLGPAPTDRDDGASLWWRGERLHRRVLAAPARLAPLFVGERDAVERAWLREPPRSAEAFRRADELLASWTARVEHEPRGDVRPRAVRAYWRRRDAMAGRPAGVHPPERRGEGG